ncbi:unnamed protein product, partial [Brassica oleracea]
RSDSKFRSDFRFGVHLSSWRSYIPLLFIAKVRPTSRSDYRTGAIGLLGFYRFYRFYLYRVFRPLDFYRLCYSYFRLSVYVVFYISDVIVIGPFGVMLSY